MAWDLLIDRADLAHAELIDAAPVESADGQVVLKVDRVGIDRQQCDLLGVRRRDANPEVDTSTTRQHIATGRSERYPAT